MKSKGFTLIELLAVIVVLAIIALIATPMVLNTIEKSKKGAASSSAYSYVSALETKLATYMLKNGGTSYETGKHTVSELEVEVKGEAPSEGNFCIGENGTITKASIKINGYVISYDGKEATTTDLEEIEGITCDTASGEVAIVPKYFEYGTPTTSSTTDYTTLETNIFTTLYSDGTTGGVCINDGGLFCLKVNDYDNSVANLKAHFGECTDHESNTECYSSDFDCAATLDGGVYCEAYATGTVCSAGNDDGSIRCREE